MSVANFKPSAKQSTEAKLPTVQPDNYKGVVVDDKYQSLHALTPYVEGMPLTVDYYGQILGENNNVREIDPAQSGVYQQYFKVHHLDIKVQQDLTQDYDDNKGLSAVRGTAMIYPDISPNTFDYFVCKTTRGMLTLFRITNVKRLSMQRDSVHEIEYQMVGYTDRPGEGQTYLADLERKVTKKYFFHADRLVEGVSPLLKEEEHHYVENLHLEYKKITEYYFTTFPNPSYQTLVLPGQARAIYDKFLTDFILKIVSAIDHPKIPYVKALGSDNDRYMAQPNFWKAILERNALYIHQGNKFMGLVDRRLFNRQHYVAGAGMSSIDQYIYPAQSDPSSVVGGDPSPQLASLGGISDTTGPGGSVCSSGSNSWIDENSNTMPLYKRVLVDFYYVLSMPFYVNGEGQCLLEKVTWDYLEGRAIQLKELNALIRQYYSLSRLEQFYYGPLLLTFIKDTRVTQY